MPTATYKAHIAPLLRRVRDMVLPFYGQVPRWWNKDTSAANVVTELDVRVETFLAEALRQTYPAIAFVGRVCFDPYGNDYDFAPGALLVAEAGGRVANLGARTYDYRNVNFIAANPYVFDELTQGPGALFPIAG